MSTSSRCKSSNKYYLSDDERHFYSVNGYVVIKQLFDQTTLDSFRQRFTDICHDLSRQTCSIIRDKNLVSTRQNPEDYVYKIQDVLHDPAFMRFSEDPRLLHIALQFLGEELTVLNCMLINKPPASTQHPSHQDAFYFPIRPMSVVACWTAIDAATKQNGCLYCVPGSHKMDLLPHGLIQGPKKFFHGLVEESRFAPEHKRLYLEMLPGDTVFFHPYLIHGSEANTTAGYRKAMTTHYMNSACEFVELGGTVRDALVDDFKTTVAKNGFPPTYQDLWKLKCKTVKTARCHL